MAPKKENSGGKKFQGRLTGEKRVKVVKKSTEKPSGFSKSNKEFKGKSFTGSKPYEGFKKPFDKEGKPYKKDRPVADGDRPYKKKTYGDKPFTDKKTFGGKNDGSSPRGYKKPFAEAGKDRPYKNSKFDRNSDPRDTRKSSGKPSIGKKYFKEEKEKSWAEKPSNYKGRGKSYDQVSRGMEKGKSLVEEEVRLNRYIANSGLCSRREADVMIEQGLVKVNGEPVSQLGTKVKPGDDVRVDGKRISPEQAVYILLNKPKGYITSTSDPDDRATVMDLIDLPGKERIYPVGRLDRNTTGVLLLTNDGELAQKLMHPSFEIKKIYKTKLDRKPSKDHMLAWVNGVELEDGYMSFEQAGFVDEEDQTVLGLEVHSGRNRIVRRMFEHFDYEVLSLDRVMLGEFDHMKLGRGKWRFLSEKEIQYVERLKRMKGKKR